MTWRTLRSLEDSSVNFVKDFGNGKIETRFVQRDPEYFIIYLSSHSGCNKSCRFCHLTSTEQTSFEEVPYVQYSKQAEVVFEYYDRLALEVKPKKVNYNWMARGEPLANSYMLGCFEYIFNNLEEQARKRDLYSAFNISTIMPYEMENRSLKSVFQYTPVNIYYSLYCVDENFRRRWLPKSLSPEVSLRKLKEFQDHNGREVIFHWAFIDDENDHRDQVRRTVDAILKYDIKGRFNLVRYNPPNNKSRESDEHTLQRNFKIVADALENANSKVVPRVGQDVFASCGLFINE